MSIGALRINNGTFLNIKIQFLKLIINKTLNGIEEKNRDMLN